MARLRTLSLLIPLLLLAGCDKPDEPVEPVATTTPAPVATPPPAPVATVPATPADPAMSAQAVLMPTQGRTAGGELSLVPENGSLRISGTLTGLTAGASHAFHIHEKGDCSDPAAESAGPHFNPAGQPHGNRDTGPHHAGDMPNVVADAQGSARVDLVLADLELGSNGPRDVLGRAMIVHEQADDYTSQPAGNAGARIACGVIGRTVAALAPATGTPTTEPVPAAPPIDGTQPAPGPASTPASATPAPDDDGTQ